MITAISVFFVLWLWTAANAFLAPIGYEDFFGFHLGKEKIESSEVKE